MNFGKTLEELLSETPEAKVALEKDLKTLWDELQKNVAKGLEGMFPAKKDTKQFLEMAQNHLDYFLTSMSLSGTNSESCKNEELAELIEELEDTIADFEEYLSDDKASKSDGEDYKEFLIATWADFIETKKA